MSDSARGKRHNEVRNLRRFGARADCDRRKTRAGAWRCRALFLPSGQKEGGRGREPGRALPPDRCSGQVARRWCARSARPQWCESAGCGNGRSNGGGKTASLLFCREKRGGGGLGPGRVGSGCEGGEGVRGGGVTGGFQTARLWTTTWV